ncbi:uncharacterized protein LOC131256561 [Magnolia sinica]|uniref:uncharacterized protein LOC131256561 n=1 Tax=Magnolia sinica TaxID=86752 RepID=UPI00265ACF82|nr:uncharacterized protein LOC131256561 [Magnolia sinica]
MEGEADGYGGIEEVCGLCGDIGFRTALFPCKRCGFRLQHSYCSRKYPNIDIKSWCCDWCLHEEEKQASRKSRVFEFLLEIAQSFPEKSPSGNEEKRVCRREEKRIASSTGEKGGLKKNSKALDRWRSLAKNKIGCRRYKLLADVC